MRDGNEGMSKAWETPMDAFGGLVEFEGRMMGVTLWMQAAGWTTRFDHGLVARLCSLDNRDSVTDRMTARCAKDIMEPADRFESLDS